MTRSRLGSLLCRVSFVTLAALLVCGCTLALQRDHNQCATSDDCQALAAGAVCTDRGICESLSIPAVCRRNADCDPSSLCRDGVCKSLLVEDCTALGRATNSAHEERLPVGILVPRAELASVPAIGVRGAASIAIDEMNDELSSEPGELRIVAVACPDDGPSAIGKLAGLGVRVLVGPMRSSDLLPSSAQVAGRAVFFSPLANAPVFKTDLSSSVVSCAPNASDAYASLMSALQSVRRRLIDTGRIAADSTAAMALSTNEANLGFSNTFKTDVLRPIETVQYNASDAKGLPRALDLQQLRPRLIASGSAEDDWTRNIDAVDNASNQTRPYYFLNGKQPNVLALATDAGGPMPRLYDRVFGLDRHLGPASADAAVAFEAAFGAATNNAVSLGLAAVYDCTYLAIYAALAARLRFDLLTDELSPDAIVVGLKAVTDTTGRPTPVGSASLLAGIETLQATRGADASLRLIGASGSLDFSLPSAEELLRDRTSKYQSPQPDTQEIYCVDPSAKAFCDTGVLFGADGRMATTPRRDCACSPY